MLRCFPSRCNRLRHSELWLTWLSRSGGVKGGGTNTRTLGDMHARARALDADAFGARVCGHMANIFCVDGGGE